jgi:Na+-driven multidrug efflux pump
VMNLCLTGGLVLVAYLFSEHLVALFITDPKVIAVTQTLLHIVLWSVVLFGAASVFAGVMRSSGTVLVPMIISLGAILGVELPGAILLSRQLGLQGIWIAYAASFSTMLVAQGLYYQFGWKRKTIKALI